MASEPSCATIPEDWPLLSRCAAALLGGPPATLSQAALQGSPHPDPRLRGPGGDSHPWGLGSCPPGWGRRLRCGCRGRAATGLGASQKWDGCKVVPGLRFPQGPPTPGTPDSELPLWGLSVAQVLMAAWLAGWCPWGVLRRAWVPGSGGGRQAPAAATPAAEIREPSVGRAAGQVGAALRRGFHEAEEGSVSGRVSAGDTWAPHKHGRAVDLCPQGGEHAASSNVTAREPASVQTPQQALTPMGGCTCGGGS